MDEFEAQWAPPNDPVFLLTPTPFDDQAQILYANLGSPPVSSNTFWEVYTNVLGAFRLVNSNVELDNVLSQPIDLAIDDVPLLEGLQDLPNGQDDVGDHGYVYMGGLDKPPLPDPEEGASGGAENDLREYVIFSDPDLTSESE